MDSKRLIKAAKKAFFLITAVFSGCVVLVAAATAFYGELIYPEVIGRLVFIAVLLFFLTTFKIYLSGTKWACNKPYVVVNLMFAPFYFGCGMMGIYMFNSQTDPKDIFFFALIFLIIFSIMQLVVYLVKKAGTDKLNDALNDYHKEHLKDGYEEEMVDHR